MANEPEDHPSPSPPPSRETTPPPGAASSAASARGSRSEFVEDAGPEFDPEAAAAEAPPPPDPEAPPALEPEWEEQTIRDVLGIQGRLLHAAIGVAEEDWIHTDVDLQAIAPPLARIFNRYEPIRRYAGHADPLMLAIAFGSYGTRSLLERRQVLAAMAPEEDTQPIPPAEAAPPPQPPPAAPPPPPRQTQGAAPGQAPAMQPSEGPPPPPPPRPAEAEVDPTQMEWRVGG